MTVISKAYEPAAVEAKWYARWLAEGVFKANPVSPKPAYAIVMPPPNVTGVLTLSGSGSLSEYQQALRSITFSNPISDAPGTTRTFEAGPDGLQVLIFGPHVEGDGEMVEDFW